MKACTKCGISKDLEQFALELKRGVCKRRADCIVCRRNQASLHKRSAYAEWRKGLDALKVAPCFDCGKQFPPYVMDFDHVAPATKRGEIGQSFGSTWGALEMSKCVLRCACCHRLRRTSSARAGRKRQILRDLKNRPCLDCGGSFHYSQMDFDHVRGRKTAPVATMTGRPLAEILHEVAKCDVVCANCHRIRTHVRKGGGQIQSTSDGSRSLLVPEDWKSFAGQMEDQSVAALYGLTRATVWAYRKQHRIPSYKRLPQVAWQSLAGTDRDVVVARFGGVTRSAVGHYRQRLGIPAYASPREQRASA